MPAIRKDKGKATRPQRGIYVHNAPHPVAIATSSVSHTRLHKHHNPLPLEPVVEEEDASRGNEMDVEPFTTLEDADGSATQSPPCVSGIRVRAKAKRYANSVSLEQPYPLYTY